MRRSPDLASSCSGGAQWRSRKAAPPDELADDAARILLPASGSGELQCRSNERSGGTGMGSAGPWMDSLGLSMGFNLFFICFLIYQGGHLNRLGKDPFTLTFRPRRLWCPPQLIFL